VRPTISGKDFSEAAVRRIDAAKQGSREAIGEVLEACRLYLLLVATQHLAPELRGKDGVSDLVQETFLEAHRDFGQFQGKSEEELLGWLRGILLHNVADLGRRYRDSEMRQVAREVALADFPRGALQEGLVAPTQTPSAQAVAREEDAEMQRALEQLPEQYRQVIVLHHRERLPFEEVGRRLGRSAEAARKLWARAVEKLQRNLETPDGP
jgi:RNA polymerase sigma-70 factor (ECF subfamily)